MSTPSDRQPGAAPGPDLYSINGDIYGAVVRPTRRAAQAALADVIAGTRLSDLAMVDVGAGIGTALPALAAAGSGPLYAVEPSSHMRAGLMAVVASSDVLAPRTTVLGGTLDTVAHLIPDTLGLVVCLNAIGHFDEAGVQGFWDFVGQRLAPGGRVVIGLQPPDAPVTIDWTDFGAATIGDLVYRTRGRADPIDHRRVAWTMRWTISASDGTTLEEREGVSAWATMGPADLERAARSAGLTPGPSSAEWMLHSYAKTPAG